MPNYAWLENKSAKKTKIVSKLLSPMFCKPSRFPGNQRQARTAAWHGTSAGTKNVGRRRRRTLWHTALAQGKRNLCRAFLMVLLVAFLLLLPHVPILCQDPFASSTSLERSGVNPCASAHWSGMPGCLANPTPHTLCKVCAFTAHQANRIRERGQLLLLDFRRQGRCPRSSR